MSTRWFCGTFITFAVVLMLAGCKSSDTGQSAAPQPSPQQAAPPQQGAAPKQAASATAPRTVGHTEIKDTSGHHQPAGDDGDHCFKRDDSRDLVLTFTHDAVKTGTVSAYLIDVVNGILDDVPIIDDSDKNNGMVTIRFSDQGAPSAKASNRHNDAGAPFSKPSNGERIMHLGPGPYVEVTTVDSTSALGASAAGHQLPVFDTFPYITVKDPKTQCP